MIERKQIRKFSRRVVREFHPRRIILFGSHAHGAPTEDSDVDILVILPFRGRAVDKSVEIRMKTLPPFPVDLLVRTPKMVRKRMAMGDSFMRDILEKGTVLYEADDS